MRVSSKPNFSKRKLHLMCAHVCHNLNTYLIFDSYFDKLQQNVGVLADVLGQTLPPLVAEQEKKVSDNRLLL
jgi:hypothetical protein